MANLVSSVPHNTTTVSPTMCPPCSGSRLVDGHYLITDLYNRLFPVGGGRSVGLSAVSRNLYRFALESATSQLYPLAHASLYCTVAAKLYCSKGSRFTIGAQLGSRPRSNGVWMSVSWVCLLWTHLVWTAIVYWIPVAMHMWLAALQCGKF